MNDHILSAYDNELKDLRSIIGRMGGLAAEQLDAAMQALRENDMDLAQKTRAADKELDKLDTLAEQTAIAVFARRAPVANDLREVVSALKIAGMIERIGDYAKNIAKRTQAMHSNNAVPFPAVLEPMAVSASKMVQRIMDAHARRDADTAQQVWESDEALDNLHNSAHAHILDRMKKNPNHIEVYTHYLMIAKNLERIGDQTTNIAEQIYYTVKGVHLEQSRPKHDLTSQTLFGETSSSQ
jgi:phosphate transport system protein